jgi:predicted DNA-binding protein YlxM (UPF0122 family)
MSRLLDTFGGLLTAKQREYFEMYYNDDLSLAEIAENVGISPPGVHDIITRAGVKLRETERKTGLAARIVAVRAGTAQATELAERLRAKYPEDADTAQLLTILNEVENGI